MLGRRCHEREAARPRQRKARSGDLFFQRAGAENRSANLEAFAHDVSGVQFVGASGDSADEDHAALVSHGFLAGFDVRATHEIEQHVDAFAFCPFFCRDGRSSNCGAGRVQLRGPGFRLFDFVDRARGSVRDRLDRANKLHAAKPTPLPNGMD